MPLFLDTPQVEDVFKKLDASLGKGPGDVIKSIAAPVAKALGRQSCSSCEARRLAANAYSQLAARHGSLKAMGIITELYRLSITAPGDTVVDKLNEYLHGETSNNPVQSAAR